MNEQRPILGGTDGFRDLATPESGTGLMNPETVAGMTYALVSIQQENGAGDVCVIGRDTRPSGEALETAAVAGALKAGATVVRLGVAPTPAILKTAQIMEAGSAVALTASHNEWTDNGWKGTLGENKPVGPEVQAISDRYWSQIDSGLDVPVNGHTVEAHPELVDEYAWMVAKDIKRAFGCERPLEGKIVLADAANGAAMRATPAVLQQLGATVETFSCDGKGYINDGCGATDLEGVKNYMRAHPELASDPNFIGAVANDGDADRFMGVGVTVSKTGAMEFIELEGNRVMELRAKGQPGIVGTDYSNDAMVERVRKSGTDFEFCPNGDVNVTAALRKNGWRNGGEFSGHHVGLDWLSSGDGVHTAAWTAAYAARNNTTFAELAHSMPLYPEIMTKVKLPGVETSRILGSPLVKQCIQAVKMELGQEPDEEGNIVTASGGQEGRVLVRASGTEKGVIRSWMVGKRSPKQLTAFSADIENAIRAAAA